MPLRSFVCLSQVMIKILKFQESGSGHNGSTSACGGGCYNHRLVEQWNMERGDGPTQPRHITRTDLFILILELRAIQILLQRLLVLTGLCPKNRSSRLLFLSTLPVSHNILLPLPPSNPPRIDCDGRTLNRKSLQQAQAKSTTI